MSVTEKRLAQLALAAMNCTDRNTAQKILAEAYAMGQLQRLEFDAERRWGER